MNVQQEVVEQLKENTRRTELLSLINKEKHSLKQLIDSQPQRKKYFKKLEKNHTRFLEDLEKLVNIIREQKIQMQQLKHEIYVLKTKGLPAKVSRKEGSSKQLVKLEEKEETKAWDEFGQYIDVDMDFDEEKELKLEELGSDSRDL